MTLSTRAFQLARSGQVADLPSLERRLKSDGCRAVALLAPRTFSGHLEAICAATFKASGVSVLDMATAQER